MLRLQVHLVLLVLLSFSFEVRAEDLCELTQLLSSTSSTAATLAEQDQYKAVTPDPSLWVLQWHDEFDTPGRLDPTKWKFETGGTGWGNKEAQYYTDREQNARVEDGKLIIEAHLENYGNKRFTSARINSVAKMTYGKIEFRAKLPHGRGTWGAAWMLAAKQVHGTWFWPDNGEFDILEAVGNENNINHFSTHSKANNFGNKTQYTYLDQVYEGDQYFHVYSAEWLPESIRFYRDGVLKYEVNKNAGDDWHRWPFDQDMVIIMNLAVGGTWGAELSPIDESNFPTRLEFDYVRVFRPAFKNPGCKTLLPNLTR